MRNATDIAKVSPFVLVPEVFAMHLGSFILGRYAHLHKAFVTVEQLRWQRVSVDGKPHSHSFWRDGDEKRITTVEVSWLKTTATTLPAVLKSGY